MYNQNLLLYELLYFVASGVSPHCNLRSGRYNPIIIKSPRESRRIGTTNTTPYGAAIVEIWDNKGIVHAN